MPLKHWQAWGMDHPSRKPDTVFDHSLDIEIFPNVQSKAPLAQLWATSMCPITGYQGQRLPLHFPSSGRSRDPWRHPSVSFSPRYFMHTSTLTSFLNCGTQNCTHYLRWGCTNTKYSGIITVFDQLVILCFMNCGMQFVLSAARAHCWFIWCLLSTSTPDPFLQGCSPATCLAIYTCAWSYSILGAESSIWTC